MTDYGGLDGKQKMFDEFRFPIRIKPDGPEYIRSLSAEDQHLNSFRLFFYPDIQQTRTGPCGLLTYGSQDAVEWILFD
jgi:hypothetical protein